MRTFSLKTLLLVGAALALGACSSTKSIIGLEKQSPDEFEVVTRAPLSLPPDYGLRAPAPGKQRPQEKTVRTAARDTLLQGSGNRAVAGQRAARPNGASRGEAALLSRAGALNADDSIRAKVDSESSALLNANQDVFDKVMFWQETPKPGVIVDPKKEAKRLREARALGKPVNKGDVPVIQRKEKGILEGIF